MVIRISTVLILSPESDGAVGVVSSTRILTVPRSSPRSGATHDTINNNGPTAFLQPRRFLLIQKAQ